VAWRCKSFHCRHFTRFGCDGSVSCERIRDSGQSSTPGGGDGSFPHKISRIGVKLRR
jgi:hypothetical protein